MSKKNKMEVKVDNAPAIRRGAGVFLPAAVAVILTAGVYLLMNGHYLFPDGQGDFSYLPSLVFDLPSIFFDGDIDFYNEFVRMRIPVPLAVTDTGYISNIWSFGSAFLWTPFYLVAKLFGPEGANPYGSWFWQWVNFGSFFYGGVTFLLLVKILKKINHGLPAAAVAALAFFGTPMFFYTFVISSTAHGVSAFAATLLVWYWLYSRESYKTKSRYALLGLIAGVTAMTRPQEALFIAPVITELVFRYFKKELPPKKIISSLAVFAAFFVAGFSPQMFLWKFIYGSFFAAPSGFNLSLSYFKPLAVLFSPYHGIALWTPVILVSFAGLILGCVRRPQVYAGLLVAVAGQFFVNACCVAYWEGYSFGLRQMTSSLPVIAMGMYEIIIFTSQKSKTIRVFAWLSVAVPSLWTVGLLLAYYGGLDLLGFVPAAELVNAQKNLAYNAVIAAKKIAAAPHPSIIEFLLAIAVAAAFFAMLRSAGRFLDRNKPLPVVIIVCLILAGYNALIIKAHYNKPTYNIPPGLTIPADKLGDFFKNQVHDIMRDVVN